MKMIFLDMDGIVADFVGAMHVAHNRPYAYANGMNRGKGLEDIWGLSQKEFWSTDTYDFWKTIEPTHDAEEIVKLVVDRYGQNNVAVATSPSWGAGCVPGKRDWMRKRFPLLAQNMIFTKAKHFLAGPNRVLIDDLDRNVEAFVHAGGHGLLLPRDWNSLGDASGESVNVLRQMLDLLPE